MNHKAKDARGKLVKEPFDYRYTKNQRVLMYYNGRLVKTLKGNVAERFMAQIADCDVAEAQLLMAKATGNFKRGNERNKS